MMYKCEKDIWPWTNNEVWYNFGSLDIDPDDFLKYIMSTPSKPKEDVLSKEDNQEQKKASNKQEGGSHYRNFVIQPAEFCQKNNLPFLESNAIKYITRHRFKNKEEDIKKAIHCLELILEFTYEK